MRHWLLDDTGKGYDQCRTQDTVIIMIRNIKRPCIAVQKVSVNEVASDKTQNKVVHVQCGLLVMKVEKGEVKILNGHSFRTGVRQ